MTHPLRLLAGMPLLLLAIPGYYSLRRQSEIAPLLLIWVISIFLPGLLTNTPVIRHFTGVTALYLPALPALALLAAASLKPLKAAESRLILVFLALFTLSQFFFFLCKMGVDPFHSGLLEAMNKNRDMIFSIYEKAN